MREWLLMLVPVVIIIYFVVYPNELRVWTHNLIQ